MNYIRDFLVYGRLKTRKKECSDHNKKNLAYEELVKKYKEVDDVVSKKTVTKKINSLRSVFRKELFKVKKIGSLWQGEVDVYKPSLPYSDWL